MQNIINQKNDRGFTLFELMVVLVIIGIIAAISSPVFFNLLSRYRLNQAFQELLGAINETQRIAIQKGMRCTISFNTNNNDITTNSPSCMLRKRNLSSEVTIKTNFPGVTPNISFSQKGSTTRMGTMVVSSNNTNLQKCFVISLGLGIKRTGDYSDNGSSSVSSSNCQSN